MRLLKTILLRDQICRSLVCLMCQFTAIANTTLQMVSPHHLRGRVMSVYMLVFNGTTPIGNLFTGVLATPFGAPLALFISALLSLIAAVFGWIYRKPAEKSLV